MVAYLEFGGAEIKGSERRGQRSPGQWGPKRKFPFCSRGPKLSLGPGGASLRSRLLPGRSAYCPRGSDAPAGSAVPGGGSRWVGGAGLSVTERSGAPFRLLGRSKRSWRAPEFSAGPELFHRGPGEGLNFWTLGFPADGNGEALLDPSHFTR